MYACPVNNIYMTCFQVGSDRASRVPWIKAINSSDVSQCGDNPCTLIPCNNNGRCVVTADGGYSCLCKVGKGGEHCNKGKM